MLGEMPAAAGVLCMYNLISRVKRYFSDKRLSY